MSPVTVVSPVTFYPTNPIAGQRVTFDASYYLDAGRTMVYTWDFGDSVVEGVTVSHVFNVVGDYSVTLRMTEDSVLRAELTESFSVRPLVYPLLEVWSDQYNSELIVSPRLRPGQDFQVQLRVAEMPGFNGYDLALLYDQNILLASAVSFDGSIFGDANLPVAADLNSPGGVRIAAVAVGALFSGNGLLATVTFRVVGTGSSPLGLRDDVLALGSQEVSHSHRDSGFHNRYGRGLLGDANGDRRVDILDAGIVALGFGKTISDPDFLTGSDVNHDGRVAITDAAILAFNFGQPLP